MQESNWNLMIDVLFAYILVHKLSLQIEMTIHLLKIHKYFLTSQSG